MVLHNKPIERAELLEVQAQAAKEKVSQARTETETSRATIKVWIKDAIEKAEARATQENGRARNQAFGSWTQYCSCRRGKAPSRWRDRNRTPKVQ